MDLKDLSEEITSQLVYRSLIMREDYDSVYEVILRGLKGSLDGKLVDKQDVLTRTEKNS